MKEQYITDERDLPRILSDALHDDRVAFREWLALARCLDLVPTGRWVGNMPEMKRKSDNGAYNMIRRLRLTFEWWWSSDPPMTLRQAWRKAGVTI